MLKHTIIAFLIIATYLGKSQRYQLIASCDLRLGLADSSMYMYIPISNEMRKNSGLLDSTLTLLHLSKEYKINKYLNSLGKQGGQGSDFYLAKALVNIYYGLYDESSLDILKVTSPEYSFLAELIKLDMEREIKTVNGNVDFEAFLIKYQALADKHADNPVLKKIISTRVVYLRYNE